MERKTNKEQIVEECERIERLLLMVALASSRLFSAAVDDPEFETTEGPDYAHALRRLRIHCERVAQLSEGVDPELDVDLHKYSMDCVRANKAEARRLDRVQ